MSDEQRRAATEPLQLRVGDAYVRRSQIHGRFGGQFQGGISTPAGHPVILIFSGEAGEQHGYTDYWDDHGCFHYFGEGQAGDMTFVRGNKALRDHRATRKSVHLFEPLKREPTRVVYRGALELDDWEYVDDVPDTAGNLRRGIKFCFRPVGEFTRANVNDPERQPSNTPTAVRPRARSVSPMDELIDGAVRKLVELGEFDPPSLDEARERIARQVAARSGQPKFRSALLAAYSSRCAVSDCNVIEVLEAAHIMPYRNAKSNHVSNGLLLRSDLHTLFDRGLMQIHQTHGDRFTVSMSDELLETPYGDLHGKQLRPPMSAVLAPDAGAVSARRRLPSM